MKIRNILLNLLSFPVWILYYLSTISSRELFMFGMDVDVLLLVMLGFTIFNLFSKSIKEFIFRSIALIFSTTTACYVSGHLYLNLCHHMSDEYYAVLMFTLDTALFGTVFFAITLVMNLVVRLIIRKIRKTGFN